MSSSLSRVVITCKSIKLALIGKREKSTTTPTSGSELVDLLESLVGHHHGEDDNYDDQGEDGENDGGQVADDPALPPPAVGSPGVTRLGDGVTL
jgi:hypothetical protein